jgi:hypothetical protein
MQFQLPRYAPPGSFGPSDTYMHDTNGTGGTDSQTAPRKNLMFQIPQGQPPQTWGQPQQQGATIAPGGSMAQSGNQAPAPNLGTAMQQYPSALGDYLNRGMGGAPGTGMPQRIQGPRRMSASPQFNRIAGVRMP